MAEPKSILDGIVSGEDIDRVYTKRNSNYLYRRVSKEDIETCISEGWELTAQKGKKSVRMRKPKDTGPAFEDEVWCIFKRMGFNEMNGDGTFSITRSGMNISKQIDVFAKDDQCVCLVECKAADKPHSRRSLDKDIDQIASIKHDIELSVFSHYKTEEGYKKLKVKWILATRNIDISENDLERARQGKIAVIDDIQYYEELSKHFGRSAKYQFLSDMFPGIEIPELIPPVSALKGRMGKEVFYSFVLEPAQLLKIAYIAHRAKTDEETINTYQRMAKKSRLKKMADYIHTKEGIFPTSIVINIETRQPIRFDQAKGMGGKNAALGTLYLPNKYKTAWIIDGQHRLFAYSDLEEAETATLPVIAFENLDTDTQAKLFVDINGEQVRVPKSLLSDLWATIHWNSDNPGDQLKALTSRLVKKLGDDPRSPLRDRIIDIGGRKTKTRNITLAALVDEIRKRQLLGSVSSRKAEVITPGSLFIEGLDSTLDRATEVIAGYLQHYANYNDVLRRQWETGGGEGGYVSTNSGLIALIRILKTILDHLESKDCIETKRFKASDLVERIWKYQEPVCKFLANAHPSVISEFRGQYGEAGFRVCTFALLAEINKEFTCFDPPGLQQYIQSLNSKNNPVAYSLVSEIEIAAMNYVTVRLKAKFGEDISQWWHNGVPEKVRTPAMQKGQNAGEYYHYERFLDFINWYEIISQNFELLGDLFTIDAKPTDSKKKRLDWWVKANEIRRIVAHPPRGVATDEQIEYLRRIRDDLIPRLKLSDVATAR